MKAALNRCLGILVCGIAVFSLAGCAEHLTSRDFSAQLDPKALYESFEVKPVDLSTGSQCNGPPSAKIVSIESRTEDYEVCADLRGNKYITPNDLMDSVSSYLKDGFEKSRIRVDDQSAKVLQLLIVDIHGS